MAGDAKYQQVRQTSVRQINFPKKNLCWTFLKKDILKEEAQNAHGKKYFHLADTNELSSLTKKQRRHTY